MKNLNLRNEVYKACPENLYGEIKGVKQFIESFNEPITLDAEWISFISENVGYIESPKVRAIEFWYLPSNNAKIPEGLLTTLYTDIEKKNLIYHGIEQYALSDPLTDKLDEIYWGYLGRLGTYVPLNAAICFSTPEDMIQYPREEEIKMMSEMFKVREKEIMPLVKARTLNHMHFLGIRIKPQISLWGKWWLKRNIFDRFLNKNS